MVSDELRRRRAHLINRLNTYEELLYELMKAPASSEFAIVLSIRTSPDAYPSVVFEASELYSPNMVELRANVQKQIELFRNELKDLI